MYVVFFGVKPSLPVIKVKGRYTGVVCCLVRMCTLGYMSMYWNVWPLIVHVHVRRRVYYPHVTVLRSVCSYKFKVQ